jgi:two-component system, NarL family, response regulator NreC
MQDKKRVVIGEDHTILRQGLSALLCSLPEYDVVKEAKDGLETIEAVDQEMPDLLLIDLSMPRMNGIEAIREIKNKHQKVKIIVLTVHEEEEYVLASIKAGADGYVLKNSPKEELIMALSEVSRGKRFFSPSIDSKISPNDFNKHNKKRSTSWDRLTPRERQILKLIAQGHTTKDIASLLAISLKTVGTHRTNLMRKLDLHSVSEVTAYAAKRGVLEA